MTSNQQAEELAAMLIAQLTGQVQFQQVQTQQPAMMQQPIPQAPAALSPDPGNFSEAQALISAIRGRLSTGGDLSPLPSPRGVPPPAAVAVPAAQPAPQATATPDKEKKEGGYKTARMALLRQHQQQRRQKQVEERPKSPTSPRRATPPAAPTAAAPAPVQATVAAPTKPTLPPAAPVNSTPPASTTRELQAQPRDLSPDPMLADLKAKARGTAGRRTAESRPPEKERAQASQERYALAAERDEMTSSLEEARIAAGVAEAARDAANEQMGQLQAAMAEAAARGQADLAAARLETEKALAAIAQVRICPHPIHA
ncbi:hypothetical protein PAPYR_11347 [Paratrimastix pyriformis]|uniref:Uncharacterized protein n=1 Tax=Paratrimastix pyriformis TaxID=342808 RepID=A0ABQ8U3Y2_9EUKA|nr:hypothetical protein PAPYR_11347 [Paratrimastix pyriformis]